ncbi:MAG: hypothetical protein QOE11_481 [Solirubrobacteraceae bacterium]|jgi:hypothetical protein|nr:hypothetical protein [Solirubrobacteraceae bacterium]
MDASRRPQACASAALLATLVLGACGGGGGGSGSTAAPAAPAAPATPAAPAAPAPAPAPTAAQLTIGIGEQGFQMFTDKRFEALGIKKARLVTAYDAVNVRFERDIDDAWLARAQAAGVEPFITFGHSRVHPDRLPSVAEFRAAFRAFRKRYPQVTIYAPWNEINHASQPTSRNPERAAEYYNVVRSECSACTVLAGDVLDQPGMVAYLQRYRSRLAGTPRIWGLHNYSDTNRFRDTGVRALLGAVKGDVWLTETGGLVHFGKSFPQDEQRAARAVTFAIRQARKSRRIKRIYLYNWTGSKPTDRFDSGLIGPDGRARPGYERLRAALKG